MGFNFKLPKLGGLGKRIAQAEESKSYSGFIPKAAAKTRGQGFTSVARMPTQTYGSLAELRKATAPKPLASGLNKLKNAGSNAVDAVKSKSQNAGSFLQRQGQKAKAAITSRRNTSTPVAAKSVSIDYTPSAKRAEALRMQSYATAGRRKTRSSALEKPAPTPAWKENAVPFKATGKYRRAPEPIQKKSL